MEDKCILLWLLQTALFPVSTALARPHSTMTPWHQESRTGVVSTFSIQCISPTIREMVLALSDSYLDCMQMVIGTSEGSNRLTTWPVRVTKASRKITTRYIVYPVL